jgi:hypothetical protein
MTNLDIILDKAPSMRAWFQDPRTKTFFEWLLAERQSPDRQLKEASDVHVMYRAQGEIARLDRILGLEALVVQHLKKQTK